MSRSIFRLLINLLIDKKTPRDCFKLRTIKVRNFGLFWHKLDTAAVAAATDTLKKILTDRTNNRKTLSKRGQFDYFVAPHNTTTTHWTE